MKRQRADQKAKVLRGNANIHPVSTKRSDARCRRDARLPNLAARGFNMKTILVLAVSVFFVAAGTVSADENRFAVVTLNNNTQDVTIHFSYRWGNGPWQTVYNLKPGRAEWFSMPLNNGSRRSSKTTSGRCSTPTQEYE
jgi:hypothetical protein